MLTFDSWFNNINWLLRQRTEAGDFASADKFARLSSDDAKTVLNMALDYLASRCEERYSCTEAIEVPSDGKKLKLPKVYSRVYGLAFSGDTEFRHIANSSDLNSRIRRMSDNVIYNEDGWNAGDEINLRVARFPEHVLDDNDVIDFPRGFYELLNLEVVKTVKYQSEQSMPQLMWATYQRLMFQWQNSAGVMREQGIVRLKRRGIGV